MASSSLIIHMSHAEREGLRALAEQQGMSERQVLRGLLCAAIPIPPVKPKRRYPRYQLDIWEEVMSYAVARTEENGYVSASDLVRGVGIAYATAGKYIDRLIYELGWTSEPARRPPRGKVAGPKV